MIKVSVSLLSIKFFNLPGVIPIVNRRQFLAGSAIALTTPRAFANEPVHLDYTPEVYEQVRASGKPYLLGFHAGW